MHKMGRWVMGLCLVVPLTACQFYHPERAQSLHGARGSKHHAQSSRTRSLTDSEAIIAGDDPGLRYAGLYSGVGRDVSRQCSSGKEILRVDPSGTVAMDVVHSPRVFLTGRLYPDGAVRLSGKETRGQKSDVTFDGHLTADGIVGSLFGSCYKEFILDRAS